MSDAIDAHVHLWNRATDPQPWIEPATMNVIDRDFSTSDLRVMLAETAVDRAVVVQSSNSSGETTRLLRLALDDDAIAGVVGWVDLELDVNEQLERIPESLRRTLVGVRHLVHIDPDENWLQRAEVDRGLAALGAANLSFDLVVRWWQLESAARTVARHPDLTFVLDHLGGVPDDAHHLSRWEAGLRAVAAQPNASAKLSGVSAFIDGEAGVDLARVVDTAFDSFGPSRLMYGSDWPLSQLGAGVLAWRGYVQDALAGVTDDERDAVLGANVARLYRLDSR
ncbi:amidohydrolase family protein [Agreia sp. VKM Ac-1783]|uniref:amidohydrolase family protein n=1 Tax=Agreia sp. VKM Ac-1783 TaxID=1938889 RepID=UPI000A2ACFCC|nr:amidohydrolase family protein [Agreia sp. VKM Ac-1783]SMQ70818.1 L-fuconolactonase [Agreia sp. VKM Ac-1783]